MAAAPWLLHAVVPAQPPAPFAAPPHGRVRHRDLALLVSPSGLGADPDAAATEVLRHDTLLAAHLEAGDVAPIRFGAAAASPSAASDLLRREARRLAAALAAVAGAVEFAVRIEAAPEAAERSDPEPGAPGPGGGAWLRARASQRRRASVDEAVRRRFAEAAASRLAGFARRTASPRRGGAVTGRWLDLALLVPRDAAAELAADAGRLAEEAASPGLALRLSGPWPPYSFAAAAEGAR